MTREVLVSRDDNREPVQMFCGDCGNKIVEGDHFCLVCGRAQLRAPALNPDAAVAREEPKAPAQEPQMVGAIEKPLYCSHGLYQRNLYGADREHGSETCLGCKLPYAPGSPGSGLRPAVSTTAAGRNWFLRHPIITIITAVVVAVLAVGSVATVMMFSAKRNELKGQLQTVSQSLATPTAEPVDQGFNDPRALEADVTKIWNAATPANPTPRAVSGANCVSSGDHTFQCTLNYSDGGNYELSLIVVWEDGSSWTIKPTATPDSGAPNYNDPRTLEEALTTASNGSSHGGTAGVTVTSTACTLSGESLFNCAYTYGSYTGAKFLVVVSADGSDWKYKSLP